MNCANLFVYGTLLSSFSNPYAMRLRKEAAFLGQARMRGRLYDLGSYPGMKLSLDPAEWVSGEVYRLDRPLRLLGFLDAYEVCDPRDGSAREFKRVLASAHIVNGRVCRAWVYLYAAAVRREWRIACGDYRNYAAPQRC